MDAQAAWYVVGPLMGLVIVAMLWVTNRPLGALGGYVDLQDWVRQPSKAGGWRMFFLLGVVAGGLLYAAITGGPNVTFAYDLPGIDSSVERAFVLVAGGTLMGYGARRAGGCTSGHGLCGSALASPASWIATGTFMATAVIAAHVIAWTIGGSS
jgi:uncharacterized membrane protein YedE/YeeE